jgi:hypothetical protein
MDIRIESWTLRWLKDRLKATIQFQGTRERRTQEDCHILCFWVLQEIRPWEYGTLPRRWTTSQLSYLFSTTFCDRLITAGCALWLNKMTPLRLLFLRTRIISSTSWSLVTTSNSSRIWIWEWKFMGILCSIAEVWTFSNRIILNSIDRWDLMIYIFIFITN